mmetsp:Transcript_56293/g.156831  ORF Transcript_56293/g.156831 Transcript_56293/m.156831 type:complete len:232 (+) Transcript_56293:1380-2075(+)
MALSCFARNSDASMPSESRERSRSWNKCTSFSSNTPPAADFQSFAICFSASLQPASSSFLQTSIRWPVAMTSKSRSRWASNFAVVDMPVPWLPRNAKCKGLPPRTPSASRFFCTSTACCTFVSCCFTVARPTRSESAAFMSKRTSGAGTPAKLSFVSTGNNSTSSLGKKMPKPAVQRKKRSPFGAFPSQSDFERFSSRRMPTTSLEEKEGVPMYMTSPSRPLSLILMRSPI